MCDMSAEPESQKNSAASFLANSGGKKLASSMRGGYERRYNGNGQGRKCMTVDVPKSMLCTKVQKIVNYRQAYRRHKNLVPVERMRPSLRKTRYCKTVSSVQRKKRKHLQPRAMDIS